MDAVMVTDLEKKGGWRETQTPHDVGGKYHSFAIPGLRLFVILFKPPFILAEKAVFLQALQKGGIDGAPDPVSGTRFTVIFTSGCLRICVLAGVAVFCLAARFWG